MIEFSGLKPCRYGAGRTYLLIVGRNSLQDFRGYMQRSKMGRYEVPWEVPLPGFGIRMINNDFYIA